MFGDALNEYKKSYKNGEKNRNLDHRTIRTALLGGDSQDSMEK